MYPPRCSRSSWAHAVRYGGLASRRKSLPRCCSSPARRPVTSPAARSPSTAACPATDHRLVPLHPGETVSDPQVVALAARTRAFVIEEVLPVEDRYDGDIARAGGDDFRRRLQAAAGDRGLRAPHGPVAYGGRGLSMTARARVFEAAGYALFGALAINAAAPDEGNM